MCTAKTWNGIHVADVAGLVWWLWNSDYLLPNLTNKYMGKILHVVSAAKWPMTAPFYILHLVHGTC
jgi:hypothetical protein